MMASLGIPSAHPRRMDRPRRCATAVFKSPQVSQRQHPKGRGSMRRRFGLCVLLVSLYGCIHPHTLHAQYTKLQGWCEDGNTAVTIPGTQGSGTQRFQRSYPSCTVTVYDVGTLHLSTIYADSTGTAKANPFTAA